MFRAPPAGTGPITIRALLKQGETNMGAFYWPKAPASGIWHLDPSSGRPGGDLVLSERTGEPPVREWSYKGNEGETCAQVCQRYGRVCDEATLSASTTPDQLSTAVEHTFLCAAPYLATCNDAAPTMSGIGDGFCWYRESSCPSRALPACMSVPVTGFDTGLRLCPCLEVSGRRLEETTDIPRALNLPEQHSPEGRPTALVGEDGSVKDEGDPCDEMPLPQKASSGPKRTQRDAHSAGGNPSRCPSIRAAMAARAAEHAPSASSTSDGEPRRARLNEAALAFTRTRSWSMLHVGAGFVAALLGLTALGVIHRRGTDGLRGGRRSSRTAAALGLMLTGLPEASPHNWVRSVRGRSRNTANTVLPCRRRPATDDPHIQVNPGQKFIMVRVRDRTQ